ncbi:MAG: nucleoside deaminase [Clostridia bacterium]|nr:nucleoside deaminase [Clostridia bacterium]
MEDQTQKARDIEFMKRALELAALAGERGDVPVGAVITRDGKIIAEGYNTREVVGNALGHAEIGAIDTACRASGGWRLEGCTLYVTLEPCPMCAGAVINSRISRVVYGAKDAVAGGMGSVWCIHRNPSSRTSTEIEGGLLADECRELLRTFFEKKRK